MNARPIMNFIELIENDFEEARNQIENAPNEVLDLFTSVEDIIAFFKTRNVLIPTVIENGHDKLEKLFKTPQDFFDLYNALLSENADIFAALLLTHSKSYFSTLFQKLDDLVLLALLDAGCVIDVFPEYNKRDIYKDAKVCDSLYQLASKDCQGNSCLLILECLIPRGNISQQEVDKLYLTMRNNPSIERHKIESWKNKYINQNTSSSSLLSFSLFTMGTVMVTAAMAAASDYLFRPK